MPSFAGLKSFFGRTISEGAAFAAGIAISPTLAPELQDLVNASWELHPSKAVDVGTAAAIVAEDVQKEPWGQQEAAYHGFNPDRFAAILGETLNAPGLGELFQAYRRDYITDAMFVHGLRKAKLETQWDEPLKALKTQRLDPAVIAVSGQRGTMDDANLLPVGPPSAVGKVPPMPVSPLDTLAEAAASGVDKERLAVMMRNVGLPASPDLAARMFFRTIIEEPDFYRAIAEGNTRNEWAPFLLDGFREILSAHEYTELELRGFYDRTTRLGNTDKHGMSTEDSDHLYDVLGRSLAVHAVTTGIARGGKYPGSYANVPEPYRAAIQRSNIREEWAEIAYANRYTYPSGFQIKAEVKAHDLTAAEGEAILLEIGWSPKWAKFFPEKWYGQGAATTTSPQKSATGRAVTSIGKAYIAGNTSRAQAEAELTTLGEDPATYPGLFVAWDVNRAATLQALTNTQIRNRFRNLGMSEAEALAILEGRGIPAAEALSYLTAPVRPPAT